MHLCERWEPDSNPIILILLVSLITPLSLVQIAYFLLSQIAILTPFVHRGGPLQKAHNFQD